jgi:hypothetical protein
MIFIAQSEKMKEKSHEPKLSQKNNNYGTIFKKGGRFINMPIISHEIHHIYAIYLIIQHVL